MLIPKGVHVVKKKRNDKVYAVYYYAWRGGPRLIGMPGSNEFLESYKKALSDSFAVNCNEADAKSSAVFQDIIDAYKISLEYFVLTISAQRCFERYVSNIEHEFSDMPLEILDSTECFEYFYQWRESKKGRDADAAWSALCRIVTYAKDHGRIGYNACCDLYNHGSQVVTGLSGLQQLG